MKSRRYYQLQGLAIFLTTCMMLYLPTAANGWETVKFAESPKVIEPPVTYVSQSPVIDGVLDAELRNLPVRSFTMAEKTSLDNPDVTLSYRLAYGAQFLYVYIEVEADSLTYRDRAYQNGDGYALVLTRPAPGNAPTREFYVLACSSVNRPSMEWTRNVFWYYNVDHLFTPTSDDTKTAFLDGDGTIAFELLLPWKDVHPYHPWLSDAIGFNLAVAKAVGEKDVNSYRVVDAEIGTENGPREYALLRFEEPRHTGAPQTFVLLDRNNIAEGDTLHARAVTVASQPGPEELVVFTQAGEKANIDYSIVSYEYGPGLTFEDFVVKSHNQPPGGYVAKWLSQNNESKGESGFSILPTFDRAELKRRLDGARESLSPGSRTTLEFTIEEIGSTLEKLYPYETAASPRIRIERLIDYIERAVAGEDKFAGQREFVRMAYRSKLDDTFQPYMVYLPTDFDSSRKYPLIVFLHGSASTETNIRGWRALIPDGFIALGPRGRGPSNYYCWDNAQTDIAEAIQSVKENFPIDERNVFLAGFSMGGYGVYRTFHETPGTYKAIAVFSGKPSIGFQSRAPKDAKIVDFTQPANIKIFKGVPVFIFHGKRDLNVPYADTERFVAKLKRAGASVEFHAEADKGHESPSDETIQAFFAWIDAALQKEGTR
jgi:predicted esterase